MAKKLRRMPSETGLTITSMMDMMTIILVFLLKSYSTDDISVAPSEDLQIPKSSAIKMPKLAVNVVVSRREILVDGVPVVPLERTVDPKSGQETVQIPASEKEGLVVSDLFTALDEKAQTAKRLGERAGADSDLGFKGQVLLQCDRRLPFSVVREVMYTAGQAQYGEFRFVVIKGAEG
jgi:biopolymer transport protein ExbD